MIDYVKIAANARDCGADQSQLSAAASNAGMTTRRYLLRVAGLGVAGLAGLEIGRAHV